MKRAILWCGQVLPGRRQPCDPALPRPSQKEQRRAENAPEAAHVHDDFCLQANGLDLAFRAARSLGVPEREIHACLVSRDLQPQGLQTEVRGATRDDLARLIREIADRSDPTDALLFIAVNHGSPEGLTSAEDVTDPMREDGDTILTPEHLAECLAALEGPQVLVISTCYAGVFLSMAGDTRRVLAACSGTETYLVPRSDSPTSPFLDELFGAWCGCAQNDAVTPRRLPLEEAFLHARERMAAIDGLRVPQSAGNAEWPSSGAASPGVPGARNKAKRQRS